MAKQKTIFICNGCGHETGKWMGQCPSCGQWNTLVEAEGAPQKRVVGATARSRPQPTRLKDVPAFTRGRKQTGIAELDRVLGGGLVEGSTVLIGGDPGVGKSTLLLQCCPVLARDCPLLYVTGEESTAQVKARAKRLSVESDNLYLLGETDVEAAAAHARELNAGIVIVDSIQTMSVGSLESTQGSVTQVRESTGCLSKLARDTGASVLIVGHVTKEGALAGPRVLEHMVDTVLYFEGERLDAFRILRAAKNRFGSTNEIGVFEMGDAGMRSVDNPSELFLSMRNEAAPGCAVVCALEGTRPVLLEMQALVSRSVFTAPRRMAAGLDYNRVVLLLAVLEKKLGYALGNQDAYVNVVGGLRLDERSVDLGIAAALASSFMNKAIPADTVVIGEIGLTGEVRQVAHLARRVQECAKLGFTRALVPKQALQRVEGIKAVPNDLSFGALSWLNILW